MTGTTTTAAPASSTFSVSTTTLGAVPLPSTVTVPHTTVTSAPSPPLPSLGSPGTSTGSWQPAGDPTAGGYAVYTTQLSPGPGIPPAAIAWIDSAAARLVLYAGTVEPPGTWPDQGSVPTAQQANLLAAFNSGFQIA